MQAAKYLGCTVWEMKEQPAWYRQHALVAMNVENRAAEKRRKDAARKNRR
jgi:hypothetical protein